MTNAQAAPSADDLFDKWKKFLEAGTQITADEVAAGNPQMATAVQKLIDRFLATNVTGPDTTLTCGAPSTSLNPSAPQIPGYTIEAYLGGGGMGDVWRVKDPLDETFALKVVRPDRLSSTGQERFLAEAKAMRRLSHPNVVPIRHYGIHPLPYFLMPPYPASLKDRLRDYQTDPKAAVGIMAAVAAGVGHLHDRGFVHRDLKPGNVLLDANGQPAVSDFGLVKSLTDGGISGDPGDSASGSAETRPTLGRGSNTIAGSVLGTRAYMSPEQAAGRTNEANPRWDVWALGVMLHELLTGQLPHSSDDPTRMLKATNADNPPASTVKPGLDPKLERIIQKCLARDPEKRYPNGSAVATDLSAWLGRTERWWVHAVIAGVFLAAAGLTAAIVHYSHDPDAGPATAGPADSSAAAVLVGIQKQLAAGHEVMVMGPTGMPRWSDIVVGRDIVRPFVTDVDSTFTIDSSEIVMIDLPPTGLDRYQFEVEVDQRTTGSPGHFGTYAGRHRLPTRKGGEAECFANLWFDDADPRPPGGRWTLATRAYERVPTAGGVAQGIEHSYRSYAPKVAPMDSTWHHLVMDVDPQGATWTFDGIAAGRVPFQLTPKDLNDFVKATKVNDAAQPAFSPAGGYGIIVFSGSAAFRNAYIRPTSK